MPTPTNSARRFLDATTKQLPVYYEDGTLLVYSNGSGEIFIKNKRGGSAKIRVTPHGGELRISASEGRFTSPFEVTVSTER